MVERFFDYIQGASTKKLDLWFTLFKLGWLKLFFYKDLCKQFGYKEENIFGKNTNLYQKNDKIKKLLKSFPVKSKIIVSEFF